MFNGSRCDGKAVFGEEMTRRRRHIERNVLALSGSPVAGRLGDQHRAARLIEMQIAVLAELFDIPVRVTNVAVASNAQPR